MNRDSVVYVVIFAFLIAFVFVGVLSAAYIGTKTIVDDNREFAFYSALLSSLGLDVSDKASVESAFSSVEVAGYEGQDIYRLKNADNGYNYAIVVSGPGLWGTVSIVLAVSEDLSRIRGLSILDQNETPGLGGRITENWFLAQFKGESVSTSGIDVVQTGGSGDADRSNSKVDGITGATRTSDAMEAIVNKGLKTLREAVSSLSDSDFVSAAGR
ncbi:FMN-binding protein [Spirochaetia bacterium 38H-sp]|uniref:FMN-binding protein n=1 Tax=Rarispira pelagica TaxID=3141764 RepID=A0ABU9UBV3_9SPIR